MGDVIGRAGEARPDRPLLVQVMEDGRRSPGDATDLEAARRRAKEELNRLPEAILELEEADPPYPVRISEELRKAGQALLSSLADAPGRAEEMTP
jgi:nicotinate phosphoribosyltransferase